VGWEVEGGGGRREEVEEGGGGGKRREEEGRGEEGKEGKVEDLLLQGSLGMGKTRMCTEVIKMALKHFK
jgi:hypothetical protein